jgi:hypothetical protein
MQGQDDLVSPRTIDDWHGQLLLDLTAAPAAAATAHTATAAAAAAGGGSAHHTGSQQTVPCLKQEPGAGTGAADGGAASAEGGAGADGAGASAAPAGACAGAVSGAAFAGVCWLRQPQGGRTWSTSSLALKRLDPGPLTTLGPGAAAFASAAAAAAAQSGGATTQVRRVAGPSLWSRTCCFKGPRAAASSGMWRRMLLAMHRSRMPRPWLRFRRSLWTPSFMTTRRLG